MEENHHKEVLTGQEGLIKGTNSDATFNSEVFDEEFDDKVNLHMQAIIRKHRGWEKLPCPSKDSYQETERKKFRENIVSMALERRCKNRFYVPVDETEDQQSWSELVGRKNWKSGFSAKALANYWCSAKGFPREVKMAFV